MEGDGPIWQQRLVAVLHFVLVPAAGGSQPVHGQAVFEYEREVRLGGEEWAAQLVLLGGGCGLPKLNAQNE